jgi:predicted Zn-dependent protease
VASDAGRAAGLAAFVAVGLALGWVATQRERGSDRPSAAPVAELVGRAAQTADRGLAQALGVSELDEARLGDAFAAHAPWIEAAGSDQDYVRAVLADVATAAHKGFSYRGYLVRDPTPNAHAMAGGIVLVTTGLLAILDREDALACVLAHEVGHVELSHGLDAAKYEIAAARLGAKPLGEVATVVHGALLRRTFSLAAEAEADRYAVERMMASRWDPGGCAAAFRSLGAASSGDGQTSLLREYLSSHPPVAQREARARAAAEAWWADHPGEARWRGLSAFRARRAVAAGPVDGEEPVQGGAP